MLTNASVLPDGLIFDDFSPCNYLPHLQQVLFSTDALDTSVTYESFVIISDSLNVSLRERFGEDVDISGTFVRMYSLTSFYLIIELTSYLFHTAFGELWAFVSPPFHRVFW